MNLSPAVQTWPPRLPERRLEPPEPALSWEELRQAVEDECLRRWRALKALVLAGASHGVIAAALAAFERAWEDRDEVRAGRNPFE